MLKRLLPFFVLAGLPCAPKLAGAQASPMDVPGCDLAKSPKAFDRKLIRVRGTLSVHFENFSLDIPNCETRQSIWLAFGGDVPGIVPSTVNETGFRYKGPRCFLRNQERCQLSETLCLDRRASRLQA